MMKGREMIEFTHCDKLDGLCRMDSHPDTGFVFCPVIRSFQTAGWAKAINAEEEKKYGYSS